MAIAGESLIILAVLVGVAGVGLAVVIGLVEVMGSRSSASKNAQRPKTSSGTLATRRCSSDECRFGNRAGANYCARCGESLSGQSGLSSERMKE